jgi:hypothetical protein
MLTPKIEVTRTDKNDCLTIFDITGDYSVTNPGGWGDPNPEREAITSAKLTLLKNREKISDKSVTNIVQQGMVDGEGKIGFGCVFEGDIKDDAVYQVRYMITDDNGDLYFFDDYAVIYVHDYVERQLSKLWALLARMTDIYNKQDFEKECIWLEANYNGLLTLSRTKNTEQYMSLYNFIIKRLENIKNIYL